MTPFLPSVVKAKRERGYRVRLTFNDGVEATLDVEQWLRGPVFDAVKAPRYFGRMFVDGGGLAWPNGADIAPETLYDAALAELGGKRQRPPSRVRERRPAFPASSKRDRRKRQTRKTP